MGAGDRGDPATVRCPLTPLDRVQARGRLARSLVVTIPVRAVQFGLTYSVCHCLAAALPLLPLVRDAGGLGDLLLNALAYGGTATMLRALASGHLAAGQKQGRRGGR